MKKNSDKREPVDWDAMEPEWRAGLVSVLQLSRDYGVSRAGIIKHWDKEGVERDLLAKIQARAEALVTHDAVTPKVTPEQRVTERNVVEANAQVVADTILRHRADVKRAIDVVVLLWGLIEAELGSPEQFEHIGEIMSSPDEFGNDKLNDMYKAALSLPQEVKNVKRLVEALKLLVELERKILRIESMPDPVEAAARGAAEGAAKGASEVSRSMLAELIDELGNAEAGA